eukprot:s640_g18.t1
MLSNLTFGGRVDFLGRTSSPRLDVQSLDMSQTSPSHCDGGPQAFETCPFSVICNECDGKKSSKLETICHSFSSTDFHAAWRRPKPICLAFT